MEFINYILYNPETGAITQWGRGQRPSSGTWCEIAELQDFSNYRMNTQTLVPEQKSTWSCVVNAIEIPADGVSEFVVTQIPSETQVTLRLPDQTQQNYRITDSELLITSEIPGKILLKFYHDLYQIPDIQAEFI